MVLFVALDLSIEFETFEQLYNDATAKPFNFYMLIHEIIHIEICLRKDTY